jgi:CxxC motif-containing protein (DUF1111 family)
MADPFDSDGDGISGKINYLNPKKYFQRKAIHIDSAGMYIGRFGKKAKEITLLDQIVFAFKKDMGLTTDFDNKDIFNPQIAEEASDNIIAPEVSSAIVEKIVFYLRTLKTPTRRNLNDPEVIKGEQLFKMIGCNGCHKPKLTTAKSDIKAISKKEFSAYTDLLLHDMGSILDDGFPEGNASGNEWRTPPLWGLGLTANSQEGETFYMHDGRAKSLEEAIAFHGNGEATTVSSNFFALEKNDQKNIIKFLESL